MNPPKVILGLDVSKAKLDACLRLPQPRTCTVPNTPAGHARLLAWAAPAGPLHLCLEATSTYGFPVARHAHAAGHTVSILQPLAVHRYAQATLARNKTDRLDAALIADFGHTQQPRPWTPPTAAQADLQAQSRLRTELVQAQQGWTNRLATAQAVVRPVLRQVIRSLQAQIAKLDRQLAATLRADPELQRQAQLLRSIPAVGPVLCAGLLAELPAELRDARAATAYAGLNPRHRESGSSVRGRTTLSKVGNAQLRRHLYVPALAGLQFNPVLRAQTQRLLAKGKPGKVRVGAAMRKLLCLCVGVLRSNQPWNPTGRPTPKTSDRKSSP
jgi:transposase